ncbi:hypothetical protein KI387_040818, partial [Taxus chinensis]
GSEVEGSKYRYMWLVMAQMAGGGGMEMERRELVGGTLTGSGGQVYPALATSPGPYG